MNKEWVFGDKEVSRRLQRCKGRSSLTLKRLSQPESSKNNRAMARKGATPCQQ